MRHCIAFLWTLAAGCLIAMDGPAAQAPPTPQNPPVFRGTTTLVPVDVRVLDSRGEPVTDLTQSDFTLLENDVPQVIKHFSALRFTAETPAVMATAPVSPGAASAAPPASPDDAIQLQHRRVFLIVLGRGRLQGISRGVDGMLHFVRERLLPQDLVAVVAWNRATAFTTDHSKIVDMLERFKRAHEGVEAKLGLRFSGLAGLYGSKDIPASLQRDIDAVFGDSAGPRARAIPSPTG